MLIVTDAAPYMLKSIRGLQTLFGKAVHVTCCAHGLHRIAECVRDQFPVVDSLISAGKKTLLKAPQRVRQYTETAPGLPFPPQPILTRWGTWLDAAFFYASNLEQVKEIFQKFDPEDAASIAQAQNALDTARLAADLAFIHAHFHPLRDTIRQLERSKMPLSDALKLVNNASNSLPKENTQRARNIREKCNGVFGRNPGFAVLSQISAIVEGSEIDPPADPALTPADIAFFKNAPVTNCDIERAFSRYGHMFSDRRHNFLFETLKKHFLLLCNSQVEQIDVDLEMA